MVLAASTSFLARNGMERAVSAGPRKCLAPPPIASPGLVRGKEALARPWGDTAEIGRPEWRGTLIGDSFWDCLGLARALQALPGGSENRPADAAKAAEQQAVSDASELHIQECEPWSPGTGKTGLLSCI